MNNIIKGNPAQGLAGATLGFFFGSATISLFGASSAKFSELMTLSPFMLSLLIAIPSLSGSLLRIPFGAWVDTTGGKKPFLILLAIAILGMIGLDVILEHNYPYTMDSVQVYTLMLIFGCLAGCSIAVFSVGSGQVSYWYSKRKQGKALGVFGGIGTSAAGIFAFLMPVMLNYWGVNNSYLAWTVFLVIGTVLYAIIACDAPYFQYRRVNLTEAEAIEKAKEEGQELFPGGSLKHSLIHSAKVPATWILIFSYFCTFGGFMALTAWFPTFWAKNFSLPIFEAGVLTAIFSVFAAFVRIPSGILSDKIGGLKVSTIAMVIMFVASIVVGVSSNIVLSFVGAMLFSISFGLNNSAVLKLIPSYVPKYIGGAIGWIGGLGAFGGFVIPPLMGKIASTNELTGYANGFFLFAVFALINLCTIYFILSKNKSS